MLAAGVSGGCDLISFNNNPVYIVTELMGRAASVQTSSVSPCLITERSTIVMQMQCFTFFCAE